MARDLDVESPEPAGQGGGGGADGHQAAIAVGELDDLAEHRQDRSVVELVGVVDEHHEVGMATSQLDERVEVPGAEDVCAREAGAPPAGCRCAPRR